MRLLKPDPTLPWTTIHSSIHASVLSQAGKMVRWVKATPRPHGALRYQCPVTGSLILVTDEAALARLARPRARLRCMDCGEMHLLAQDAGAV